MPQQYNYPTNLQLTTIDQSYMQNLTDKDPIFGDFPIKTTNSHMIQWDQKDNYTGLMNARGLGGAFQSVPRVGQNRFEHFPGVYGEFADVSEEEIVTRASFGSLNQPIDVSEIIMELMNQLRARQVQRIKWSIFTFLTTGKLSVLTQNGAVAVNDSVPLRQYFATTTWATTASATPLADFRTVKLNHRGQSAMFNSSATAWMSLKTFNYLIANSNAADLGGRRSTGLETIEGLTQYNTLAMKDDLPQVRVYDETYLLADGTAYGAATTYIPDNVVVVVGKRTNGAPLGEFRMTRNAANPNVAPGEYVEVVRGVEPPHLPRVYRSFNGGPVIWYPGAITIMNV